jgi:hypothetical protein
MLDTSFVTVAPSNGGALACGPGAERDQILFPIVAEMAAKPRSSFSVGFKPRFSPLAQPC